MRRALAALAVAPLFAASSLAEAQVVAPSPAAPPSGGVSASASASVPTLPPTDDETAPSASLLPEAPPEAPPPLPRKKGLVLEAGLGALGYAGQFRHVAPPGFWIHGQLGWEFFRWLMIFGEGEMTYTDTSVAQDETKAHAFPMFGFGGGARFTLHFTERVAGFLQGQLGAMKADVPIDELAVLGFKNAESFGLYFGGRLGLEYYQVDRHLAIGLAVGGRDANGFAKLGGTSDSGLMWDAQATIRYTF